MHKRHLSRLIFPLVCIAMPARPQERASDPVESVQFESRRLDFKLGGARAFVIFPRETPATPGTSERPWVWYAPTFIGRHPDSSHAWMFARLLAAGYHICGIEVGESFGNPEGRALYEKLHGHVVRHYGLSRKPVLLPQSRGGLMLYNWAAEHPESVARIAGIYTVCDIRSYPGLEKAAPAYGPTAEELAKIPGMHNPVDRLAPLARAGVPIFHIHGDADAVVPIEANSAELVRRYRALGGEAALKIVPGKGHQVCDEFFRDEEFLRFILGEPGPPPSLR